MPAITTFANHGSRSVRAIRSAIGTVSPTRIGAMVSAWRSSPSYDTIASTNSIT